MTKATKSLMVVMIGPDALAGSVPILLNKIGIITPRKEEMNIELKIAINTTKAI